MTVEDIAFEVRRFLIDHIESVAQLELLLLLRTDPSRDWTAEQLGRELRVDAAWAGAQLQLLRDMGLMVRDQLSEGGYRYVPRSSELSQIVTGLAQAYLLHRVRVTELIYSKPTGNIRAFSDAFKLRKDAPNG